MDCGVFSVVVSVIDVVVTITRSTSTASTSVPAAQATSATVPAPLYPRRRRRVNMHTIVAARDGWSVEEANRLLASDPFEAAMRGNPWTSQRLASLGTPWERFARLVEFYGWVPSI